MPNENNEPAPWGSNDFSIDDIVKLLTDGKNIQLGAIVCGDHYHGAFVIGDNEFVYRTVVQFSTAEAADAIAERIIQLLAEFAGRDVFEFNAN